MSAVAPGDLVFLRSRPWLGEVAVIGTAPLVVDIGKGCPHFAWDPRDVLADATPCPICGKCYRPKHGACGNPKCRPEA